IATACAVTTARISPLATKAFSGECHRAGARLCCRNGNAAPENKEGHHMKSYVQDLMDELEAAGIIIKNGEMRFNSQGVLQPAYVIAPQYMNDPLALEKAF